MCIFFLQLRILLSCSFIQCSLYSFSTYVRGSLYCVRNVSSYGTVFSVFVFLVSLYSSGLMLRGSHTVCNVLFSVSSYSVHCILLSALMFRVHCVFIQCIISSFFMQCFIVFTVFFFQLMLRCSVICNVLFLVSSYSVLCILLCFGVHFILCHAMQYCFEMFLKTASFHSRSEGVLQRRDARKQGFLCNVKHKTKIVSKNDTRRNVCEQ